MFIYEKLHIYFERQLFYLNYLNFNEYIGIVKFKRMKNLFEKKFVD